MRPGCLRQDDAGRQRHGIGGHAPRRSLWDGLALTMGGEVPAHPAQEGTPVRHHARLAVVCATLAASGCAATSGSPPADLRYRRVVLSPEPIEQPLLTGPPQTAGMRSGKVALAPGAHMHRHSTEGNEELLVFLRGKARVVVGAEPVPMEAGQVLYIPPQTEHEVHNDGAGELTYVYTVAPAAR